MTIWQSLLILLGGLGLVFIVSVMPMRFFRLLGRFLVNASLGLLLLFVINLFAGWTNVLLPLNTLTMAVSGLLGIPGVAALAVIAAI